MGLGWASPTFLVGFADFGGPMVRTPAEGGTSNLDLDLFFLLFITAF